MFYSDSFFEIGSTHKICQDYACHGYIDNKPYAVISDGCSSAEDTDFGSRILVKSLLKNIYNPDYNIKSLFDYTINFANISRKSLLLKEESLFATICLLKRLENCFEISGVGDYLIAINYEKYIKVIEYEFVSGAPYYLAYELDNAKGRQKYFDTFGGKILRKETDLLLNDNNSITTQEPKLENFILNKESDIFFSDLVAGDNIKSIVICSDGARSFRKNVITKTSKIDVDSPAQESLIHFINYKNYVGEFIQRRAIKAKKELNNDLIFHYDDLSIAGISNFIE
jgi:hypothetical protein